MRQRLKTAGSLLATGTVWTLLFLVGMLGIYAATSLSGTAPVTVGWRLPDFVLAPPQPDPTTLQSAARYAGGCLSWAGALFLGNWLFWFVLWCFSLFVALVADRFKR